MSRSVFSIELDQVSITGIVAASVAVTFKLTPHPITGAPVTASSVRQTFDDSVRLPRLDVSTTGPVSGVLSSVAPTEESAPPRSPTGGNSNDDAADAMQVKKNALLVLLAVALGVVVVCVTCGVALGMYCRKHLVPEADAQAAGVQKANQIPAQTVAP